MQPTQVVCPSCQSALKCPAPPAAGQKMQCPKCAYKFRYQPPLEAPRGGVPAGAAVAGAVSPANRAVEPPPIVALVVPHAPPAPVEPPRSGGKGKLLIAAFVVVALAAGAVTAYQALMGGRPGETEDAVARAGGESADEMGGEGTSGGESGGDAGQGGGNSSGGAGSSGDASAGTGGGRGGGTSGDSGNGEGGPPSGGKWEGTTDYAALDAAGATPAEGGKPLDVSVPVDLAGHRSPVAGLAFSPDGTMLISCDRDGYVRLWRFQTGDYVRWRPADKRFDPSYYGAAAKVGFSGDGRTAFAGSRTGVWTWDVATGRERAVAGDPDDMSYPPLVSANAETIVALDYVEDYRCRVFDGHAGREVFSFGKVGSSTRAAVSADGGMVALAGEESIRLYDVTAGRERAAIMGVSRADYGLGLAPDGSLLALSDGRELQLWSLRDAVAKLDFKERVDGLGQDFFFSADGARLLFVDGSTVTLWDVATRSVLRTFEHAGGHAVVSADGGTLAAEHRQTLHVVDVATGAIRDTIAAWRDGGERRDERQHTRAFALSADGGLAAVGLEDGTIALRPVPEVAAVTPIVTLAIEPPTTQDNFSDRDVECNFSLDNRLLAVRGTFAALCDLEAKEVRFVLRDPRQDSPPLRQVVSTLFQPGGKLLIACGAGSDSKRRLYAFDLDDGKGAPRLADANEYAYFRLAPDESAVVGSVRQPNLNEGRAALLLMDPAKGEVRETLDAQGDLYPIRKPLCFSSDGRYVAAAVQSGAVKIWDLTSSQPVPTTAQRATQALALLDQGRTLATSDGAVLDLFDVASGQAQGSIEIAALHAGAMADIAFSTAAGHFVSVGELGEALLRDRDTGDVLLRLPGHENNVVAADFSTDGALLATVTTEVVETTVDGSTQRRTVPTVRVWAVGQILAAARTAAPAEALTLPAAVPPTGFALADPPTEAATIATALPTDHDTVLLDFSREGVSLVAGGFDGTYGVALELYDLPAQATRHRWEQSYYAQREPAAERPFRMAPRGRALLADSSNSVLISFHLADGSVREGTDRFDVQGIAVAPDGRVLAAAVAGQADALALLDPLTLEPVARPGIKLTDGHVAALAFDRAGGTLAVVHRGETEERLLLLDASTFQPQGEPVYTIRAKRNEFPDYPPRYLCFSPDGQTLAVVGRTATFWSLADRRRLYDPPKSSPRGEFDRFIGDRKHLASDGSRFFVRDVETGRTLQAIDPSEQHPDGWQSAVSADGRLLATAGEDGRAALWNVEFGQPVAVWAAHPGKIKGIAVSATGRMVATAGEEGAIKVWSLEKR